MTLKVLSLLMRFKESRIKDKKRIGFEFKYSDSLTVTSSMKIAIATLNLDQLKIIYPGTKRAKLGQNIECIPLNEFL